MPVPVSQNRGLNSQSRAVRTAISLALLGPMYVSTTLVLLGLVAIFVFVVPKFKEISKDFGVQLTPMQKLCYATSDVLAGANGGFPCWALAVPAILGIMAGIAILFFVPASQRIGKLVLILLFIFAVALVATTVVSCFSPLAKMIENLSSDPARAV